MIYEEEFTIEPEQEITLVARGRPNAPGEELRRIRILHRPTPPAWQHEPWNLSLPRIDQGPRKSSEPDVRSGLTAAGDGSIDIRPLGRTCIRDHEKCWASNQQRSSNADPVFWRERIIQEFVETGPVRRKG